MKRHYRPYPEYKDSGVEWLGQIPAHWDVRRLKFVADINTDTLPETTPKDFSLRYIDIGNVSSEGQILNIQDYLFGDAPSRARRKVKEGDTIISTVRTYLQAIAFIDRQFSDCIVSTGFAVLRPQEFVVPKFLYYLVRSKGFVDAVMAYSVGVSYPAINPSTLAGLWVLLPPLPEQRAIATFLDRETAHIDALIAKKRELIDLLRRQRTALISHAVTKGLDPSVPLKDSGVEWLGQIPAHWDVRRLKFVADINTDTLPETTPKDFSLRYIDIGNVSSEGQILNIQDYLFGDAPSRARRKVKEGDTIISTVRTYLQAIAFIDRQFSDCIVSTGFAVLRPQEFVVPKFLYYLVRSKGFVDAVMAYSVGVSYPAINPSTLAGLWVLLPPLPEQRAIAEYLDCETARIDGLIQKIEKSIELLQRQRTALISAAVTGKIDVRDMVDDRGVGVL